MKWLTVATPDGRELEVLRHGAADGRPLVSHVGTPSAPDEFLPLMQAVDERGWQLVSYARPGYSASTRQVGRTVADAAGDVAAILDHLGLDRFLTMGRSGGGPHALACATLLPDRCEAAATIASIAPWDADGLEFTAGMGPENVEEYGAAAGSAAELHAFLDEAAPGLASVTADDIADSLGGLVGEADRNALTGDIADGIARQVRRALSRGTAGWFDDDIAFVTPWGFDLDAIAVPVSVWHGGDDRFVPYSHGEWLAAHVPGARVHLYDDEGHISLVRQLPRILDDFG
jgi:pimeloyl-ACP methyl ester carboxylesterase